MLLRMSQYDAEIYYKHGRTMHVADMLSRDTYTRERDPDQDRHSQINAVSHFCMGKERLGELRREIMMIKYCQH